MFIFPSKVNVKIKFRYFTNDCGLARIYFQSCRNGLALQYTLVTTIIDTSKVHSVQPRQSRDALLSKNFEHDPLPT